MIRGTRPDHAASKFRLERTHGLFLVAVGDQDRGSLPHSRSKALRSPSPTREGGIWPCRASVRPHVLARVLASAQARGSGPAALAALAQGPPQGGS